MNSIALPSTCTSRARILVVESDSQRATLLSDSLRRNDIEVEIADSVTAALRSLGAQIPDLLLTSTFLPPADEAVLTAHLKEMPAARHLQIINVPYFIEAPGASSSKPSNPKVLTFLRRTPPPIVARCDVRTLRVQIGAYLSQARERRLEADGQGLSDTTRPLERALVPRPKQIDDWIARPVATSSARVASSRANASFAMPADRRRTRRLTGGDTPWLYTIKVSGGLDVRVIDISKRRRTARNVVQAG